VAEFYNGFSSGLKAPISEEEIWSMNMGYSSDHSEDQKKFAKLSRERKIYCVRLVRGREILHDELPYTTSKRLLDDARELAISELGGREAWSLLSELLQQEYDTKIVARVCVALATQEYGTLSEDEQRQLDLYVQSGCCSHKELNAFKGACTAMSRFWVDNNLDGPRKLMNRDNAATAAVNPGTQAADRALAQSQGGIVNTSLAGALFLNKDKKKGQQDSYLIFFEKIYGYSIPFPNTSSTRYQSYYRAATVLICYRGDILDFLCQIALREESGKLNHLEQNVYDGLNDLPTLTEMCAAVHYSLAIAIPYMRAVRSYSTNGTNVLDLGPFHRNLLLYTAHLADHPELLLASDASWGSGTFDGTPWDDPSAFYSVKKVAQTENLHQLEGVLVAALRGALETWKRFTSEFVEGGLIDSLTPSDRKLIFLLPTNDLNEGGLGQRRQASIHSPFMTNLQFNARKMYRQNSTRLWMRKCLVPSDHIYLRKLSRKVG
jgi:hypothetical protein